jgi:hypothetical protein
VVGLRRRLGGGRAVDGQDPVGRGAGRVAGLEAARAGGAQVGVDEWPERAVLVDRRGGGPERGAEPQGDAAAGSQRAGEQGGGHLVGAGVEIEARPHAERVGAGLEAAAVVGRQAVGRRVVERHGEVLEHAVGEQLHGGEVQPMVALAGREPVGQDGGGQRSLRLAQPARVGVVGVARVAVEGIAVGTQGGAVHAVVGLLLDRVVVVGDAHDDAGGQRAQARRTRAQLRQDLERRECRRRRRVDAAGGDEPAQREGLERDDQQVGRRRLGA